MTRTITDLIESGSQLGSADAYQSSMAISLRRIADVVAGEPRLAGGADGDAEMQRIVEWHDRVESRRRAGEMERNIWIMAARRVFAPSERQPCWVCGRFQSIAQAHHAVPLTTQYDRGFQLPDNEHVWLCPNHHVMAHIFIQSDERSMSPAAMRSRDRSIAALNPDLSEDEINKMFDLMRLAARSPE